MSDPSFTRLTTTRARIYARRPCPEGWQRGIEAFGSDVPEDKPIPYSDLALRLQWIDTLWCLQAEPQYAKHWRLFAVWCARQVQHLLTDQRSLNALDVAERHARGLATDEELAAAEVAARDAAWAARDAAGDAAGAAAWAAAGAAWWAARDAAGDAAWAAACAAGDAAWAAACAAGDAARVAARDVAEVAARDAAEVAARVAAWDAAGDAARTAQKQAFIQLCDTGTLPSLS
jgi:hypothetical protein